MPQRNLRHSHYIYSNHSDNKLITLFCNQFATTPPKNPVFSGISSFFLLFPLNCANWLRRQIQQNAVDAGNLMGDTIGNVVKDGVGNLLNGC